VQVLAGVAKVVHGGAVKIRERPKLACFPLKKRPQNTDSARRAR
jgi:hypothetical protein